MHYVNLPNLQDLEYHIIYFLSLNCCIFNIQKNEYINIELSLGFVLYST